LVFGFWFLVKNQSRVQINYKELQVKSPFNKGGLGGILGFRAGVIAARTLGIRYNKGIKTTKGRSLTAPPIIHGL
jgi:hypothetical protein